MFPECLENFKIILTVEGEILTLEQPNYTFSFCIGYPIPKDILYQYF